MSTRDTIYKVERDVRLALCKILDIEKSSSIQSIDSLVVTDQDLILNFTTASGSESVSTVLPISEQLEIKSNVQNYNELLTITGQELYDFAYVRESQGTQWQSAIGIGKYYGSGLYMWDGTEWIEDDTDIFTQLENILNSISLLQVNQVDNRIVVKQASDFGVIDSSKVYLVDGVVDMGTSQIEVPSGGVYIKGLDYFVSSLFSNENNYTMFVNANGQPSGNVRINNVELYTTGVNSQIFNLDNQGNFGAIEFQSTNFGRFASQQENIGNLDNYRQFRTNDCAFIRVFQGIEFNGTWAGGFRIGDSILLSIPANATVFKEGTSLVFEGSSFTDLNAISIDSTSIVFDFQESNFLLDEGFKIEGGRFNLDSNPIPNLLESSVKVLYKGRGINNTFPGGEWEMVGQQTTPFTAGAAAVKMLGATNYRNLVHFSSNGDNSFRYNSSIPKSFIISGQIILDGGPNDEIELLIVKINTVNSTQQTIRSFVRRVSNLVGGLDIAYFDPYTTVLLEQFDDIEIYGRNLTDDSNATILDGSFLAINVRD